MGIPEQLQKLKDDDIGLEGGVTAHVSVVRRELGITCVVGISNATRHIPDGGLVEVDAEKGIVRILGRNR